MSDKKQSSDQRISELETKIKGLEESNRLLLKDSLANQLRANRIEFGAIINKVKEHGFMNEFQAEGIIPTRPDTGLQNKVKLKDVEQV